MAQRQSYVECSISANSRLLALSQSPLCAVALRGHVLRDIEELRKEIGPDLDRSWFRDDSFFDRYNRNQSCLA